MVVWLARIHEASSDAKVFYSFFRIIVAVLVVVVVMMIYLVVAYMVTCIGVMIMNDGGEGGRDARSYMSSFCVFLTHPHFSVFPLPTYFSLTYQVIDGDGEFSK